MLSLGIVSVVVIIGNTSVVTVGVLVSGVLLSFLDGLMSLEFLCEAAGVLLKYLYIRKLIGARFFIIDHSTHFLIFFARAGKFPYTAPIRRMSLSKRGNQ